MIIEALLTPIYNLIISLFDLFPQFPKFVYSLNSLFTFLQIANTLLPDGYLVKFLASVLIFKNFSIFWAVIEWIYKKIPGVD